MRLSFPVPSAFPPLRCLCCFCSLLWNF